MMRQKRMSDEAWMELINECRTSGISDHQWCIDHGIKVSTFYAALNRLWKKACIPQEKKAILPVEKQDVVPVKIEELQEARVLHAAEASTEPNAFHGTLRLKLGSCALELSNEADERLICTVIRVLRELC